MSYESIQVTPRHGGQVVHVALGPPPANIVTAGVIGELSHALGVAAAEPDTKTIVITGQGKHFSYGASVEEHQADQIASVLPRLHALIGEILSCPVPTIAAVSGLCLGGGFEVAMACSLIFCDAKAKFGVPEIKLGVFPPVASVLLPPLVGTGAAARIVLSGENHDAETMRTLGAVSVAPEGALDESVDEYIGAHILPRSAVALRMANRAVRSGLARHYHSRISTVEDMYLGDLMSSEDAREGIAAFLEKRAPQWKNR